MLRQGRWKYVSSAEDNPDLLFDMENDPGEFNNLWDHPDYKEIRFELMKVNFDRLAFAVDVGPEATSVY